MYIFHYLLSSHTSKTFPFEGRSDIETIAVSHDSRLMIAVDTDGRSLLVNLKKAVVLYRFNFKKRVRVLTFSPDDAFIAVSHGNVVQVWHTPGLTREFSPFVHYRTYGGHNDDVLSIQWSPCSKFFVTGSKDLTARLFSIVAYPGYKAMTLAGHRDAVVGAFFAADGKQIYTVGKDGGAFVWEGVVLDDELTDGEENEESNEELPHLAKRAKWCTVKKHVLKMEYAKVVCVTFQQKLGLLVVGFSNGTFGLYETPDMNNVHTLSISQNKISTVSVNASGDWLAFGSKQLGQLLVWEWQSETYVLKQQGHYFDLNVLDYSPNGQIVATGADDAKLKLWNSNNGFCFVTLTDHTGPVTGVKFTSNGSAVVSASLDGTVRAYDLERYKNFRTLTTPSPVQFISLALDASGQIVCAGTLDPFNIYVWSLQTGRLLDVLSGHEGPVTSLSFSPSNSSELILASGSWDHTVRLWDVYQNKSFIEPLPHSHDVLSVAFRPDGKQLVSATLNGNLNIWDVSEGKQLATIEGQRDVAGGRKSTDRISAKNNSISKHFTSVCYSADGNCILAGGESKYVCIYEASQQILLKKYQISHNRSLEGVLDQLHSAKMTEAGPVGNFLLDGDSGDEGQSRDSNLLGAKRAVDPGSRRQKMAIRSKAVVFSPTGRAWATASTEGLLIYSLNENMLFDPFDLDESITPDSIVAYTRKGEYSRALLMSLHLNQESLMKDTLESIPTESIPLVAESMRDAYLKRLLMFLSKRLETSPHVEYYLTWTLALLRIHGPTLQDRSTDFLEAFRALQKALMMYLQDLSKLYVFILSRCFLSIFILIFLF